MKKFRFLLLFVLLALVLSMLTACPIVPHRFQWDISTVYCNVTYINGTTLKTKINQGVAYYNPNGIHSKMTYIEFFEDGTLIFKPLDENELKGTYRCKNNGISDTTIYISLENGEEIEALGVGSYYDDNLYMEYHGSKYEFSSRLYSNDICEDEKEYQEQLRTFAEDLRYAEENQKYSYIRKATVAFDENGGATLISEDEEIDLYSENIGVVAIRITDNNEVIYLNEIEAGECYFYGGHPTDYYTQESPSLISLFYLDPLPEKEEEKNPTACTIFNIYPELAGYYDESAKNKITVTMSRELVNQGLGFSNYYNRITNQEDIDNILSTIMWMVLWDYGPPSDDYLNNIYSIDTITLSHNSGALPEITISNYYDRIKVGETWYYHNAYEFPSFIYENSFMKFACYDYNAEVYKNNEFLGYVSILEDIEYIIDPNQDYDYTSLHDKRTLITEFGELTVYDATHFRYKGQFYLVVGETTFEQLYQIEQ